MTSSKKSLFPTPVASDSGHGHQGTWSTTGFNLHNVALGKGKFPKGWSDPTSSAEGSPASRSVLPASVLESLTSDGSGPSSREFYAYYDPGTRSLRTSQASFIEDSTPSCVTFTKRGLMRSGFVYALPTLERPTDESESLSSDTWTTPCAGDVMSLKPQLRPSRIATGRKTDYLARQVLMRDRWPTPTSRDWKDGSAEACKNVPVNSLLGREVHQHPTETVGGQLNPTWVEWLQGFPLGWTEV